MVSAFICWLDLDRATPPGRNAPLTRNSHFGGHVRSLRLPSQLGGGVASHQSLAPTPRFTIRQNLPPRLLERWRVESASNLPRRCKVSSVF